MLCNFRPVIKNKLLQVDVFGAGASEEDADRFVDDCLKVVHHIYTSLRLHVKYVRVHLLN